MHSFAGVFSVCFLAGFIFLRCFTGVLPLHFLARCFFSPLSGTGFFQALFQKGFSVGFSAGASPVHMFWRSLFPGGFLRAFFGRGLILAVLL